MKRLSFSIILILSICLCALVIVLRAFVVPAEYNERLRGLGIEASMPGVENYIWNSIQPGISRDEVLSRLTPLGNINVTKMGEECEGLAVNLENKPGEHLSFYVPPDAPPGYQVGLCYSGGKVSEITSFNRVEDDGYVRPIITTMQARPTSSP